jgi:hypothetical protein
MLGRLNLFTVDVSRCHLSKRVLARVLDKPEIDASVQASVDVDSSTYMVEFRSSCTAETLRRAIKDELGDKARYARVYCHDD